MWIFRLLLPAVLLILIIGFASLNSNPDQVVSVDLYFEHYYNQPVAIVVFVSILVGMVLMFTISIFHDIKVRNQLRKLRQENRRLSEELTTLRTSPFREDSAREEAT